MSTPTLRKAERIQGRTLVLRDAGVADAAFILGLRTDERKARHLSHTPPSLSEQVAWLERYRHSTCEAYFIIEASGGEPLGTVRLYDPQGDSFCWGSWILKDGAPSSAAIESALMVYAYALDSLGFRCAHFQVQRANQRVWAFHERFGAVRVDQDDTEFRYTLSNAAIRASMQRYRRFMPAAATAEV